MLLMPGLVLVICAYLLGNLVAPPAQRLAKEFKLDISGSAFTGKELDSGIWVRDVQRNEAGEPKKISFVNAQRLRPGEAAYDWVIYVFDRPDHLTSIVTAKSGTYSEQDGWVLHDVVEETVPTLPKESREQTQERVERKVMKSMVWGKSLDGNIFGLLMIKPEDMSLQELHYYIEYLKENGQTYKRFDTAFWSKAFYPLAILVMLLLSMPFAYQNARAGGMAIKIFCGIMIGIFYYALNNLFAFMSALDSVPSIISAIIYVTGFTETIGMYGPIYEIIEKTGGKWRNWLIYPETATNTILFYSFWTGFGINMLLFQSAMSRIPAEILESGCIDGAGWIREMFVLAMPMIWPTISMTVLLAFTGIFTGGSIVLLFVTQGGESAGISTISYWIFNKTQKESSGLLGDAAAAGLFFTVISMPLILAVRWLLNKIDPGVEY